MNKQEQRAFDRGVILALTTLNYNANCPTMCKEALRAFDLDKRTPRGLDLCDFDKKQLALIRRHG